MRVNGGMCCFLWGSISCILVICHVLQHVAYCNFPQYGHNNKFFTCMIYASVIHGVSPGFMYKLFQFRVINCGSSHCVGLMWEGWKANMVFGDLCGGKGWLIYAIFVHLVWLVVCFILHVMFVCALTSFDNDVVRGVFKCINDVCY